VKLPIDTCNGEDKHLGALLTQEMLDFCAEYGIVGDVEVIGIQQINETYDRLLKSDVNYRFVIDMASLKNN
jgi:alcohol dehydrogenase (NADP+)